MNETRKISAVFCGGGTLGPVTPLLAVAKEIAAREPGASIAWVGTADGPEARLVAAAGIPFHSVSAGKLRRYFSWSNFTDLLRIVRGFFQAFALLRRLRADVVVSAGGFVAVPVTWAAGLMRIPVHVHQQDVRPGLANKLSLPFAASLSVALERSLADFANRRPTWTGNPVRREILAGSREEAVRTFGLDAAMPTVLVLGGGTGAAGLNALVRGSLPALSAAANVIHVVGTGKGADLEGAPARYRQYELLVAELPHAFAAADIVVTRAGMGVLTELAALGKPALIVPMPASHQTDNARAFADAGAGTFLDERSMTPARFAKEVLDLLSDRARRDAMAAAMRRMNRPDATARVADLVLAAVRPRG